ncbi:MAG: helix-turn-helix domain-containing protein [Lachnospiraceae bacterium]|nr:helix-turn-helix domain-containing protein [Lachnospiraceae bacterium]
MAKIDLLELRLNREQWRNVKIDAISEESRNKFENRKKAVDLYIDGVSLKTISELTGISSSEVIRHVRKCMLFDKNMEQIGYAALIPNKQNVKTIGKLQKLFLQHPSLEEFVLGNYFGDKKYTLEKNMTIRTLHTKFVAECRQMGIQDYEYPFTLKDNGYDILYTYIKQAALENQKQAIKRERIEIRQRFESTGFGESNNISALNPYGIIQIDGHKIDMLYTVEVENEHGELIRMPASRAWLIAAIDVATRTIIGYSISPYENYNQYDILMAVHNAIVPHEKIAFTHNGFSYPKNGGFPSLAFPEIEWATFDMLMLDNAKSHLAKNTLDKLLNNVKCSVNFGSVATPETRGIIERFFKTLENGGFHRLPGTTGSNINDTKRNEPEKETVKYRITFTDICELLEYLIAEYNNSAHSSLENQSPLQVMERRIRQAGMYPNIIPESMHYDIDKLTHFTEAKILRGGYSTGSKPHITYLGTKYHAYDRKISMDMIGKRVLIEINPADVSHLDLYDENGVFIANLIATGEWGKRPHSLRTHKEALARKNRNKETNNVFSPDLSLYEDELRKNALKSRRERTKSAIAEREMGKNYRNMTPSEPIKFKPDISVNNTTTYTKEEMDLIDSLSIEEAYRRGLI